MMPDINSIKSRRLKMGIKQKELANHSKVSQSMIAKLESGRIEPSYIVVKKIFSALDSLEHKKEKTCKEIMSSPLISVKRNDSISKALALMKSKSISQLPVIENKRCFGSISESTILEKLIEGESKTSLSNHKVLDIMSEPFPIVRKDMPLSLVISLLKASEAILVSDKDSLVGIITKSNLI